MCLISVCMRVLYVHNILFGINYSGERGKG